jgi:RimJ/RimL family protein N-acetyltransferase
VQHWPEDPKVLEPQLAYLRVHDGHLRARQSDEGAGFVREGTLRRALFQGDRYFDVDIMGILRPQWHDSREGQ